MTQDIDLTLKEARESISNYCINTCKSKCCRKGKLILLNSNEVNTICGKKEEEYLITKILEKTENNFWHYNLEKQKCPHLRDDSKCNIHKKEYRPQVCNDFPIFKTKNYIIPANICPAVKEGLLNEYIEKMRNKGYKII